MADQRLHNDCDGGQCCACDWDRHERSTPPAGLFTSLGEAAAYLRQEADFNRSWTDGRRASGLGEAYDKCRLAAAVERDRWADAIQKAIEMLIDGREHNEMPERANG
jgi:hypothetical protein